HLKMENASIKAELKALKEGHGKIEQKSKEETAISELAETIQSSERKFSTSNPDYPEAMEVVRNAWRAEYEEAGMPEQLIDSAVTRKALQFSNAALQKGQSPAEAIYKLGGRYGYKKQQKDEQNKDKDK